MEKGDTLVENRKVMGWQIEK